MSSKRCSSCGREISSESAYCLWCGAFQAKTVGAPIPSMVRKRPPIKILIVIMFVCLAIGASLGYLYSITAGPPLARTVTQTATVTTTATTSTTITTTITTPTLSYEELSGLILVNTEKGVYRLDMKASQKPRWEFLMNESIKTRDQVSPDCRYVVYNVPESGIYITDLSTGESHILLKHAGYTQIEGLSWSPDGSRICYLKRYGGEGTNVEGIYVLELSGRIQSIDKPRGPERYKDEEGNIVLVTGELDWPMWIGAGTLIYQRFTGRWPSIWFSVAGDTTIDADTTTVATLTKTGVTLRNLAERWFVEEASVSAALLRSGEYGGFGSTGLLFLAQSSDLESGGRPTRLEFCVHYNASAVPKYRYLNKCRMARFSPDGRQIAFLVESGVYVDEHYRRFGTNETSMVLVDVAAPEKQTTIPLGIRHWRTMEGHDFEWSPNGREIVLQQVDRISMLNLETRAERTMVVASPSLLMCGAVWSSNADYLAVLAVPIVPQEHNGTVFCIVRVSDSAYYMLPSFPEDRTVGILCWLAGSL